MNLTAEFLSVCSELQAEHDNLKAHSEAVSNWKPGQSPKIGCPFCDLAVDLFVMDEDEEGPRKEATDQIISLLVRSMGILPFTLMEPAAGKLLVAKLIAIGIRISRRQVVAEGMGGAGL